MNDSKIIVALDFDRLDETLAFVAKVSPQLCRLKVGKELFTACGPFVIDKLHDLGFEVFLDLKFHDIPTTVYKAVRAAAKLGVWMLNVHASGGRAMLCAAKNAIDDSEHKPLLIAVTILTSLDVDEFNEVGYELSLEEQVIRLAKLAYNCGLSGVVCSAHEARLIKQLTNPKFLTVTPGIRLTLDKTDDQTRIMTPQLALKSGADYLVIGRPITQSLNPLIILKSIFN